LVAATRVRRWQRGLIGIVKWPEDAFKHHLSVLQGGSKMVEKAIGGI
jgi:hypothetical protein